MSKLTKFVLTLSFCLLVTVSIPRAAVPNLVSYQARLTDNTGAIVADGTYQLSFSIYDGVTLGNLLWSETHVAVNITDGSFTVYLGSVNPFVDSVFADTLAYMEIAFNGETMAPRSRLLSVPYAMRAGTIDNAVINGGLVITPDEFVTLGNAIIILDSAGNRSMEFTVDNFGNGKINFYDPVDFIDKRSLGSSAVSNKIATLSKDGLTFFGATIADTNAQIFPNGDIQTKGQITMGENSSGSADWATVFGFNNVATGDSATVSGGYNNTASGNVSVIGGGAWNIITLFGVYGTISGGFSNYINGSASTIGGGDNNTADEDGITISGGKNNTASGVNSTIGGGEQNEVSAAVNGTISGGKLNTVSGIHSVISGGLKNAAIGNFSFIGGGQNDTVTGGSSVIAGGTNNYISGGSSFVGGGQSNNITGNSAVIAGGFENAAIGHNSTIGGGQWDTTSGLWATISGGRYNKASSDYSFIGGGQSNSASGNWSTIGGGESNTTTTDYAMIGGGKLNTASGQYSFVGGGYSNISSGDHATISGGYKNLASGHLSMASGYQAQALHYGSMAFFARDIMNSSDSLMTGGVGQMVFGAKGCLYITNSSGTATYDTTKLINTSSGGYLTTGGVWTNSSDKNLKENFEIIDELEILNKISELDIYQWNYITEDDEKLHIGPTAQDFHELFGLGNDDKSISTIDPSGVALVAIKALAEKNRKLEDELSELKKLVHELLKRNK